MKTSKNTMVEMLRIMKRIRMFDEACHNLFVSGYIPGALHCYTGEEAIATGVCMNLKDTDYILSNHRGHGHLIAKGGELKYMMAELFGKKSGYCKGLGGSMHLASKSHGILGANGIVGGGICIASGVGFSINYRKTDQVVVCFFGDGAANTGFFHEGLNFASIQNAPVIFICENNLYSISMKQEEATKIGEISIRAKSYGMYGETVDGNDVLTVYKSSAKAIKRARLGKGPALLEYKTYRWRGHHAGEAEDGLFYRTKEEVDSWKKKDPIKRLQEYLLKNNIINNKNIKNMEGETKKDINDAIDFANESPYPELDYLYKNVYVEQE